MSPGPAQRGSPPDALRARVLAAAKATPAPTRVEARQQSRASVILAVVALAASAALLGVRSGGRPTGFVVMSAAGWALSSVVLSMVLMGRGRSMLGRPRSVLLAGIVIAPLLFCAVVGVGRAVFPGAWLEEEAPAVGHAFCFGVTVVLSLGVAGVLAYARRGSDPVHPTLTGAALAVGGGTWAALVLLLHCHFCDVVHLGLGHAAPLAALALLGAAVLGRVVGLRRDA